jgi:hypothetical protein
MEPEGSLSHSQEPATCPYPEAYQSNPLSPIQLLEIHFSISFHLRLGRPSGLFPSRFPTKTPVCTSLFSHTCHMPPPITLFLVLSPGYYLVSSVSPARNKYSLMQNEIIPVLFGSGAGFFINSGYAALGI